MQCHAQKQLQKPLRFVVLHSGVATYLLAMAWGACNQPGCGWPAFFLDLCHSHKSHAEPDQDLAALRCNRAGQVISLHAGLLGSCIQLVPQ